MLLILSALLSAFAAACAAIFVTFVIERFGGRVGGVIGSMPTTIIPFSIGMALTARDTAATDFPDDLAAQRDEDAATLVRALYTVPVGMFLDVGFLMLWRELPRTRWITSITDVKKQLSALVVITLGAWFVCALCIVLILQSLHNDGVNQRPIGIVFVLAALTLGLITLFSRHVPSPKASMRVTLPMYLARGTLAGCAIGLAVGISQVSDVAAGMSSAFPAIFLTTMVSLRWSHGAASGISAGAIGPLALGSLAVSVYAMSFAELAPFVERAMDGSVASVVVAVIIADMIAVCSASIPILKLITWRHQQMEARIAGETKRDPGQEPLSTAQTESESVALNQLSPPASSDPLLHSPSQSDGDQPDSAPTDEIPRSNEPLMMGDIEAPVEGIAGSATVQDV